MPDSIPDISWWEKLDQLDRQIFIKINSGTANSIFDFILPFFRDSVFWAPLYLFIFIFICLNYGKKGLMWSIAFLCTIAITDLAGTYVFKQNFERLRPCYDPDFSHHVRLLLKQCSGSYSFVSNHAANHFGIAVFIVLTFARFRPWIYIFYFWAFAIGYAQVYVGVHYPSDVIGGALLGIFSGSLVASLLHKKFGKLSLDH